jgi:hypothetical protein
MLIWYIDNICTALEYIKIRLYEYFCLVYQRVQMHFYIFRQYTYIVFILQYQNTRNNCQALQKNTRYKVVLIVFNGVQCDVNFYTVTVSYRCTVRITYQKKTISWFMMTIFMYSKNWSIQCNLTARIEPGRILVLLWCQQCC